MHTYRFGRALAWLIAVLGLIVGVVSLVVALAQVGTPGGLASFGGLARAFGLSLALSLFGFLSLALFDLTESSLRRTD